MAPRETNPFLVARKAAGLTQADVAAALGVRPATVVAWEHGTHFPQRETLERLAELYGVPTETFGPPRPAPGESDPRVWHGEMRATLRTLSGMRKALEGLAEMTEAAETSVRGLVESGVLLAAPPTAPATALPPGTIMPRIGDEPAMTPEELLRLQAAHNAAVAEVKREREEREAQGGAQGHGRRAPRAAGGR